MKAIKFASILPLLLIMAGPLWAATKYGDAVIEKGSMTIVREGRTLRFDQVNERIDINEDDLIRVRAASLVKLRSREKATLTLGANAVFHVKPWRSKGKTGFMRALFGRFRATVVGLLGGEQFNVKTATATIGVKGTKYITQVTNRAGTMLVVRDHTVGFQGQQGPETDVGQDFVSVIININPPTPPAPIPPEVSNAFSGGNLDSPPPNSPAGGSFAGENGLVRAGIVSESDLEEGRGGGSPLGGEDFTPPGLEFDPNEASDSLQRGRVRLQFQQP